MNKWAKYIEKTKGKATTPIVEEAITYTKAEGRALDLGAGCMNDTAFLIAQGFEHVDVVDSEPAVAEMVKEIDPTGKKVSVYTIPYHEFAWPRNAYDFINAQNAIPFAGPTHVADVMFGISQSMKRWGVFCGTFFGPEDEWASDPDIAIQSREAIEQYFSSGWNIHKFEEEKCERPTASGANKQWHIFHVIASRIDTM